jgi:hypothetical protein
MSVPDVRVRLSAEGVQDVIAAFHKVQADAATAAQKAGHDFEGMNKVLEGTQHLLETLGVGISVGFLVDFVKKTAEAVEETTHLAFSLGSSVENFSALATQAKISGVDVETLGGAMARLTRHTDDLRNGVPAAVALFQRLRLSAKDFAGKDSSEGLVTFARALADVRNDGTRTALTLEALGRNAFSLGVFLREAGEKGIGGLRDQARALGTLLDAQLTAAVLRLNGEMRVLQIEAAGAATQFLAGFSPQVVASIDDVGGSATNAAQSFRELGQAVGEVGRAIELIITLVFAPFLSRLVAMQTLLGGLPRLFRNIAVGNFEGASQNAKTLLFQIEQLQEALEETQRKALFPKPAPTFPAAAPFDPNAGAAAAATAAAAAARKKAFDEALAALKQELDAELKLHATQQATLRQGIDDQFAQGLLSVHKYYAIRRTLSQSATDEEIANLRRLQQEQLKNPDQKKGAEERLSLQKQIDAKTVESSNNVIELINLERDARIKAAKEVRDIENEDGSAEDSRHAKALARIQDSAEQLRKALTLEGIPEAEVELRVKAHVDQASLREEFTRALALFQQQQAVFDQKKKAIEDAAKSGHLTKNDALAALKQLDADNLPGLRQTLITLRAIAVSLDDSDLVQKIDDITAAMNKSAVAGDDFNKQVGQALQGALSGTLNEIGDKVQTLTGFFNELGLSIARALQQLASEKIAEQIIGLIPGFKSGGRVKPTAKAEGGMISGPGTGTSDSIPALVSNGEFIVRAAAVRQPGVLPHLERINRGTFPTFTDEQIAKAQRGMAQHNLVLRTSREWSIPRFADGGLVGAAATFGAAGAAGAAGRAGSDAGVPQSSRIDGVIHVVAEPGTRVTGTDLTTSDGERLVLKIIAKHRRTVGQALGR